MTEVALGLVFDSVTPILSTATPATAYSSIQNSIRLGFTAPIGTPVGTQMKSFAFTCRIGYSWQASWRRPLFAWHGYGFEQKNSAKSLFNICLRTEQHHP